MRPTRWLAPCLVLLTGCPDDDGPPTGGDLRVPTAAPAFGSQAILSERSGRGRIAYLGLDVTPKAPKRGEVVELVHYFRVERAATGDPDVFVHGEVAGTPQRVFVADHAPALGRAPVRGWKAGEIYRDPHRVKIPDDLAAGRVDLYVGLFKGKTRWTVEAPAGQTDGQDRIRAARLELGGPAPGDDLPEVVVPRTAGEIVADGRLDEPAWADAPILEFSDSMGRDVETRYPTRLRLLYDAENLYVGFEATDVDITEKFSKRDDPIYDHETVEVFLMPKVAAPEVGPYVELQASPGGVIFDASFDGRRRGMNTAYGAGQTVGTRIDGTLNDPAPDERWVSEWVVPWRGIRGIDGPPKPGDEWRMNAFRIEKFRVGGRTQGEFTAWSPPRVGDFHNVARFGRLRFAGP